MRHAANMISVVEYTLASIVGVCVPVEVNDADSGDVYSGADAGLFSDVCGVSAVPARFLFG